MIISPLHLLVLRTHLEAKNGYGRDEYLKGLNVCDM